LQDGRFACPGPASGAATLLSAASSMKVGIYGGTFDPIHNGHLILARDAVEQMDLDHIIFIPNAISPHRLRQKHAGDQHRYEMIVAAIAGEPRFRAGDMEIRRGGISYTFETVLSLKEKYPRGTGLFYLIGQDNADELDSWHRIDELKEMVSFVVFTRSNREPSHPFLKLERRVDISATEIRERVAKGLSIRYLVPDPVRQIIADRQLYKESPH
jgi:nicotinate-nucleotide adenylyltransferase